VIREVAVLGPGAVGGALAARLANAGVHTVCVARPEAVGIIALAGIVVETPTGTLTARCEAVEHLARSVGLLLVTVKAPALPEALERIDPEAVEHGVVVPLLNGLEHMEVLREHFGDRVAAGTISHYQAHRAGRVQIVEATPHPVITIASERLEPGELDGAADLLRRAVLDVRVEESEKGVLWHKLARITPLAAATSASGRTLGVLREDPLWRTRLELALAETVEVAAAEGVRLNLVEQWEIIEGMDDAMTTSAARDVAAGRRSELDAILGAVLRVAERHRIDCPVLDELAARAGLA
jgi:2-dehydropantoate 2-reductase